MTSWQLQTAKANLSEVVRAACLSGPQQITVRGKAAAVVLSRDEYDRLHRRPQKLGEFLKKSPLAGVRLKLTRSRDAFRGVSL